MGAAQGITNSCSILAGLVGTLFTGLAVDTWGSYQPVFATGILLYLSSCALWARYMRGAAVRLRSAGAAVGS